MLDIVPVTDEEGARCTTREEWLRLFLSRNPKASWLDVVPAYQASDLAPRLGGVSLDVILDVQAELGHRGSSPEGLAAQRAVGAAKRAVREAHEADLLRLSPAAAAALDDDELGRAVWLRMGPLGPPAGSIAHRLFAVGIVDGDVNNGGFDQLYRNGTDAFVAAATEGLRELGCPEHAEIIDAAAAYAAQRDPALAEHRDPGFDPFDETYYALDRGAPGRLDDRRRVFLRAHLADVAAALDWR